MKSLNTSAELWNKLSLKEMESKEYQSACCLNVKVNVQKTDAPKRSVAKNAPSASL